MCLAINDWMQLDPVGPLELQKEEEGSGNIVHCHAASYTDIKSSVAFDIAMRLMVS